MLRSRVVLFLLLALATSGLLEPARATDVSGTITTTTWTKANSPYRVTGDITVPAGHKLTIFPGVDVLFDSNAQFVVEGALAAEGAVTDSVRFLPGKAACWGGIRITGGSNCSIAYTRISGGKTTGAWPGGCGGALYVGSNTTQPTVTVSHSVFSGNQSDAGGVVFLYNGALPMTDCTVANNTGHGVETITVLTMVRCTVARNSKAGAYMGGAGFWNKSINMTNCVISENTTAGVSTYDGSIVMQDCAVWGNSGWGVQNGGNLSMTNCVVTRNTGGFSQGTMVANASLLNCTISGNGRSIYNDGAGVTLAKCLVSGGSIENYGASQRTASLTLSNCTVYNAGTVKSSCYKAPTGSLGSGYAKLKLQNTIVWGTSINVVNGEVTVTYSDIQQDAGVFPGTGNINADPLFVDPANRNFRLSALSPCVDTGDPASALDFDGSRADMGASILIPNLVPVCSPIPDVTEKEGRVIQFVISASDPDGQSLVYSATSLPDGATLYPTTGAFSWTPPRGWVAPPATRRDTTFVFFVSDGIATASASVRITVLPAERAFTVLQNAPNPFNPSTVVRFSLPEAGHVTLAVYGVNSRLVRTLVDRPLTAGLHEVVWDGRDGNGRDVASGAYIYRLTAPQGTVTRRMVLLR